MQERESMLEMIKSETAHTKLSLTQSHREDEGGHG